MLRRFLFLLLFVSSYLFSSALAGEDQAKANLQKQLKGLNLFVSSKFTVTGEVVDAWCYAAQDVGTGKGESHKGCALACARGGVTLGILDEKNGNLYIAAKSEGFQGCQELLLPYVAKRVVVTGALATKGGCRLLKIFSVKLAPPAVH